MKLMHRRTSFRLVGLFSSALAGCGPAARPAVATTSPAACAPAPAGLAPLVAPRAFTIFGDLHGSGEIPAFVGLAACHAAAGGGEVVVGLEIEGRFHADVDAYLASDGGDAARAALLAGEHWTSQDGRASRAMLALIERARQLRQAGGRVRVFLFDGVYADGETRDRGMAAAIAAVVKASPDATVLILTGNLHARIDNERWMAGQLVKAFPQLHSLDVAHAPGEVFGCSPDGCGVAKVKGAVLGPASFVELGPEARGYGGRFYVGALTASPPATWPPGRPMPAQPVSLRVQAAEAYGRKDFAGCARLFIASAARAGSGGASAQFAADDLYGAACCQALAGQTDDAFASLGKAIEAGFHDAAHMRQDSDLASLHGDARWPATVQAAEARAAKP